MATQVPLDVVCAYHERLVRCAAWLSPHDAMDWLQQRDEEERQWWADRYRNTTLPLGKIIEEGLEAREVMWKPPPPPTVATGASVHQRPPRQPRGPDAPPKQGARPDVPARADTLKNGDAICRAFNNGSCKEPCPKNMRHVCSAITSKSGHVCGMRNHGAHQCRRSQKGVGLAAGRKE